MQFSSTPAWTFGTKADIHYDKNTPGPGEYKGLKDDPSRGYTIGKSPRDKSNKLANDIGPGQYNYDYSSLSKQGVSLKGKPFVGEK